ncbi:MAG TPA: class I tRNA ligase family protein [Ignavibacteria bacterium]|nr:class I tRNA ligase family protein [Ignavibacteria bacterium]
MKYEHLQIEKKWQDFWINNKTFRTPDIDELDKSKPKYYVLDMLPYPSGDGLHVGHPEGYTATDIISRYKRMRGYNVLHPMGWDAFGLPAEQFALKKKINPKVGVEECVKRFRSQLQALGFSYDWDREVNTTDEEYYKWTQWMFLKLYNSYFDDNENKAKPIEELEIPAGLDETGKAKYLDSQRLAFISESPVNWCPELGTVLANEEVPEQIEKGFTVVRRMMKQWKLRITKYAQRLLDDLDELHWPENIKKLQYNWIGRSDGATVRFEIKGSDGKSRSIEVFTTRPDTLFGATYMVFAPEHKIIPEIVSDGQKEAVQKYIDEASRKSDLERAELSKDKTGVFTGAHAINPASGIEIPIFISDYVLMSYGTGAIMSVPGHDERDMEFAVKFGLDIIPVVTPGEYKDVAFKKIKTEEGEIIISGKGLEKMLNGEAKEFNNYCEEIKNGKTSFTGEGYSINSGFLTGLPTAEAKEKMIKWLEEKGIGKRSTNYRLRDWLFSRQRFWGEPFPLVHFEDGRIKALKEEDLPVRLPVVSSYTTSKTGESPLSLIEDWLYTTDKDTGEKVKRETNTMPQWAGSCWYYLRYIDPKNGDIFCDKEKEKYWMPVDLYIGGSEHAVLHLLYARFWHKVLFDLGYLTTREPFNVLFNQGMILGEDGVKMSKSRGNVINPDDMIREYGADSMRMFEMFMGPLEATKPWSTEGIAGLHRFLSRVWRLVIDDRTGELNSKIADEEPSDEQKKMLHTTIKKMTRDIEDGDMKFNTSIAQMMIFVNEMYKMEKVSKEIIEQFVLLLSPYAPHISEELWQRLGNNESLAYHKWPEYDEALTKAEQITVAFSVNGKVRSKRSVDADLSEKDLEQLAFDDVSVNKHIFGKNIVKIIVVKNKMVNIVVK